MKFEEMPYKRPDLAAFCAQYEALTSTVETADSEAAVTGAFARHEQLASEFETQAVLASIRHTVDTRDVFYDAENDFFDENGPVLNQKQLNFYKALLASPYRGELEGRYGPFLFEKMEQAQKCASEEILPLMQQENALQSAYQKLYASAQIPFEGKLCTLPQMTLYKENADRALREAAYRAEGAWFDAHREELEGIYDKLVKNRTLQAKKLGYENYLPLGYLRMSRFGYGPKEVEAFRRQVLEEVTPLVNELKKEQAARIGVPSLKFFDDTFRYPEGNPRPHGTPEEILAAGIEMYQNLCPETAEFIDFMEENHLFDLVSKPGKAPGGYCTYIPGYASPFIFSNFNGTAGDVDVLTHEAGHAFAAYLAAKTSLPVELREPSLEACEVHSMSMEFLTSAFHKNFFGDDVSRYAVSHAESALLFLPYGCMVDEFQQRVYERPELSPEERNAVWMELEGRYRPYNDFGDLPFYGRGAGWQRQLHIFEYPFYYIDYCLAQVVAFDFFVDYLSDPKKALASYLSYTRLAGSRPFGKLVQAAGYLPPYENGALSPVIQKIADWLKAQKV